MYRTMAHLYDWQGALDFSEKILAELSRAFDAANLKPPGRILDLGCGTGTVTLALAQSGWQVIGLDVAPSMLAVARQKAAACDVQDVQIQWREGDLRQLSFQGEFDAVLATYDTLNHVRSTEELTLALKGVFNALKPAGFFFFDLNTLANYREFWQGKDVSEGENHRIMMDASFDETTGEAVARICGQEHTEAGLVEHSEEVWQRYFPQADVRRLLEEAGFTVMAVHPFNPVSLLSEDEALKTLWWCRK